VVDFNAVCPSLGPESPYELLKGISEYTGYRRVKDDSNVRGYNSISVPGLLAGLDVLLNKYGSKKLSDLVQPALKLARDGFRVNRYVAEYIDGSHDMMGAYPETAKIFAPDGTPRVGDKIVQADLAETLRTISREGSHAFYHGRIADRIVDSMEKNGGLITRDDLAGYKARVVRPAVTSYRGYEISAPPVGSGGNALLEALNIAENFDFAPVAHYSPEMIHLLIETLKLVWADRLAYDADPEFAQVPLQGLLSKGYAKGRFKEIDMSKVMVDAKAGDPWKHHKDRRKNPRRGSTRRPPGKDSHTTQITVVDKDRNMVSLTQTVWDSFGSLVTIQVRGS
jgi:gamma-glutamyltranspeptidase / glutathione hydrolase